MLIIIKLRKYINYEFSKVEILILLCEILLI